MAITEMNFASGGASSADKVKCIGADGNESDVQAELYKLYDEYNYVDEETVVGTYKGQPLYRRMFHQTTILPNVNGEAHTVLGNLTGDDLALKSEFSADYVVISENKILQRCIGNFLYTSGGMSIYCDTYINCDQHWDAPEVTFRSCSNNLVGYGFGNIDVTVYYIKKSETV